MAITSETLAFERGVRPMMELVLPDKADAVLNFNPDPELRHVSRNSLTNQMKVN